MWSYDVFKILKHVNTIMLPFD